MWLDTGTARGPGRLALGSEPAGLRLDKETRSKRPARLLQLITSLERGGAENHLLALLTHADRQAFEIETAVLEGEGELVPVFRDAGIRTHLIKARNRFDPLALGRL